MEFLIPYLDNNLNLNLNSAPTVPKRKVCRKFAPTVPKLTFLSSFLRLCPNSASAVPQLCPNCFCLNCALTVPSTVLQVTLCPRCAWEFSFLCPNCAPTVSKEDVCP